MFLEFEPQQMNEEGHLGPIVDGCIVAAERTFFRRKGQDTNPQIVQMILRGIPVDHFYYRSEELIDQPYYLPSEFVPPYRGPAEDADPFMYGEGTYTVVTDVQYLNGKRVFTANETD